MENAIFNAEVIRDFCGSLYGQRFSSMKAASLFVLPEAITALVSNYQFSVNGSDVYESKVIIYNVLVKELKDIIPLDSTTWNNMNVINRVYNKVTSIKNCNIGERLNFVFDAILSSDYWKAAYFINNIEDGEIAKILSKSINGHNVSKLNMSNFEIYYDIFERQ
jgi:hypothetical protein